MNAEQIKIVVSMNDPLNYDSFISLAISKGVNLMTKDEYLSSLKRVFPTMNTSGSNLHTTTYSGINNSIINPTSTGSCCGGSRVR